MQIKAKNSFTNKVMPFPESDLLRVYICGPTVYNSSHLGHARTYLTFDIIRRILEGVFGKTVVYQMNITDIDDKIIVRSNEQGISAEQLARRYEADFFKDMDALNIKRPTAVTRVTECMLSIVQFVQRIIDNGYGYCSNGSVYFDTQAFLAAGFQYPKLRYITQESQQDLLQAGEGVSMKNRTDEKKCPNDFALWKAAKPGEPQWESPFGAGRPGWHIECSVMSNNVLLTEFGGFELHLGGKDLQFPHHANEVAQMEAYYNKSDLIDFFMHSGHLRIDNEVMSKSKMNFKTIEEVLKQYTANQLRILFMQVDYASDINYSISQLDNAVAIEQKIVHFFHNIGTLQVPAAPPALVPEDIALLKLQAQTQQRIKASYMNNFNYPDAFKAMVELLDAVKAYMSKQGFQPYVAAQVAGFLQTQFEIVGLGFQKKAQGSSETASQVASVLNQFRTAIKQAACAQELSKKTFLELCDEVRDKKLPPFGFLIEDKGNEAVVKEIDYEEFLKNQQREELLRQEKLEKARLLQEEKQRKIEEEKRLAQTPAEQMFRTEEYTEWDEAGIPTKMRDENGEIVDVPKSRSRKLQKEWEARKKLQEKYAGK